MTHPLQRLAATTRSRPGWVAAAALLLVVLLVGAIVLAGRDDGTPSAGAPPAPADGLRADGAAGGAAGGPTGDPASPPDAGAAPASGGSPASPAPGANTGDGGAVGPGAGGGSAGGGATTGEGGTPGGGGASSGGDGTSGGPAGSSGSSAPDPAPVVLRPPVRCVSSGTPSAPPLPGPDERDGKRWVTVGRLAGSCDATSPAFRLRGIDTRLVWRSDADSFVALIVDAVRGTDASAGFADAQCIQPCSVNQAIVPAPGDYTLQVQAGQAPWEIEVQEYRAP